MRHSFFKIALSVIIFTIFTSFSLDAHVLWVSPVEFAVKKGDTLKIKFPYAHEFPATSKTGVIEKQQLENTLLFDPAGKSVNLTLWNGDVLESKKLKADGTYLVVSVKKGGFFCKTTDGKYEKKPKNEVPNAVTSTYSKSFNKAIVTVGKAGGNVFSKIVGQAIEIIPLDNPALLKKGDEISIKVLLNGKPYETEVDTAYEGFKKDKEMFALKVKTNKEGVARVRLTNTGSWLFKANSKSPYSNPEKADEQSFTATLTFFIK